MIFSNKKKHIYINKHFNPIKKIEENKSKSRKVESDYLQSDKQDSKNRINVKYSN